MDTIGTYGIVPIISGVFSVLIDRLAPEEMRELLMGRDSAVAKLSKLRGLMLVVSKVVNDAEGKQDADTLVKTWFDEVKDTFYDAEDLVDEIHTAALQREVESKTESNQLLFSSISASLRRIRAALDPFYEEIDSRIAEITRRFEGFAQQAQVLQLKAPTPVQPQVLSFSRPPTTSLVDETTIYGRDAEIDLIINVLKDGVPDMDRQGGMKKEQIFMGPNIRVVTIVGMPGIGKTTLAQLIFNDLRADEIFQLKAWTCVGEVFDIFQLTTKILELLPGIPYHADRSNLEFYQRKLRKAVAGKRFLLVLDDVWDEKFGACWERLLLSLKSAAQGSTIVVTTHNEYIARIFDPIFILPLDGLSFDDCWNLIKEHAFSGSLATPDVSLEDICKSIVAKCRGLPLAAKVLGGLLRSAADAREWREIANNRIWELPLTHNGILPGLLLSYNFLPFHLKRCFAYCSIFPRNYRFEKEKVVLLWMAESFVEQARNSSTRLEDLGNKYFHDLLVRSFFQKPSSNQHYYVMHDLIRELAVYVMGEFGLMLEPNIAHVHVDKLRHFSYMVSKYETMEKFGLITNPNHLRLRTFLSMRSSSDPCCYLSNNVLPLLNPLFCHLRVLSLCNYKITSIPPSIGSLKHLRYLDFSSTLIEELPEFVCCLYNLQTLILSKCYKLKRLSEMMTNLLHMRHLDIRHCHMLKEMPKHIGKLCGLQTLTDFIVGENQGASIRELGEFLHLQGSLCISGLDNVVTEADASVANLRDKDLAELSLEQSPWSFSDNRQKERLLHVLEPHKSLRRLTIAGYGGDRFPGWVGDNAFEKLEILHLENSPNCVQLPPLGQLPSLKHLSIINFPLLKTVGLEFYGSSSITPFMALESLKFSGLQKWRIWVTHQADVKPGACLKGELPFIFSSLKTLILSHCPNIRVTLPRLLLLRKLKVENCGFVNLGDPAGFTSLTSLSLRWDWRRVVLDSIASVKAAIPLLSSLHELTIEIKNLSGQILEGPWFVPISVRAISVTGISEICTLINGPIGLQYLDIRGSKSPLQFLASHSHVLNYIRVSDSMDLQELEISSDGLGGFPSLYDLSVEECPQLLTFPPRGFMAANLTTLSIHCCLSLRSLPNELPIHFPSLQFLSIHKCNQLESLPVDGFPLHLQTLHISDCRKLELLPPSCLPPNLHQLEVSGCTSLRSLPEGLHSMLTSLERLCITYCPEIESFPQGGLPPSLEILLVSNCHKLISTYADWQLHRLRFLKDLAIEGFLDAATFPADGSLPSTLEHLSIHSCPNLSSINCFELQRLPCLRELEVENCPSVREFFGGLPESLCHLAIVKSPLLEASCQEPYGCDVHRISLSTTSIHLDSLESFFANFRRRLV